MSDKIASCGACGQKNRIREYVRTKKLRCGNRRCREPLATPAIVERLTAIQNELIRLDREFARFGSRSQQATLTNTFERQVKILKALPDYPGYKNTVYATKDLCIDIEHRAEKLKKKLDTHIYAMARRALDTFLDIFKGGGGPAALIRGFTGE